MRKILISLVGLLVAIPLFAVTPRFWETRSYEEFRRGKLTNLSLTSDDELTLAPSFNSIFNTDQTLIWSTAADSKGNVYLGTGHDGKIYKVDAAGKGTTVATLRELDVSALAIDSKDVLYAGTSPDGKVYRIVPGQEPKEFYKPDAKYIWSLVFDRQGRLYVGTGDHGVIYRVTADGKGETFYTTDETHIISMTLDKDGNLIAGGDPKGYIYRISPEGKAFVLYDSGMREVHALALGPSGSIYAAVLSSRPSFTTNSNPISTTAAPGPVPTISITVGGDSASASSVATQTVEASSEPADTAPAPVPHSGNRHEGSDSNATSTILEILPDGTVNILWQGRDEMVFSLLPRGSRLLFSTGTKGRIYSLQNSRDTTLLAESTEEQTTSLLEAGNAIYAASSNVGKLFKLGDKPSTTGTYESVVRDTDAISTWGHVTDKGTNLDLVQIFTRTGNTNTPDKTWSDWMPINVAGNVLSPKARFIQWKAALRSDNARTPSISSVTVPYLQQNFRPEVTSVEVLPAGVALVKNPAYNSNGSPSNPNDAAAARANARLGQPGPIRIPPRRVGQKGAQSFQWTATDRNDDYLVYDLYYRGESERGWKILKKGLDDNFYTIDSDTLPDGKYLIRVVASDQPSNPAETALTGEMESQPFTIDNTPPSVSMKQESLEQGRVRIAIDAQDATSTLNQAEISIDTGDWQPIFPKDGIIDSSQELFSYQSPALPSGEHVIAFRVYDQNDNVGMSKLVIRIP